VTSPANRALTSTEPRSTGAQPWPAATRAATSRVVCCSTATKMPGPTTDTSRYSDPTAAKSAGASTWPAIASTAYPDSAISASPPATGTVSPSRARVRCTAPTVRGAPYAVPVA
jgi:hypothetical protein